MKPVPAVALTSRLSRAVPRSTTKEATRRKLLVYLAPRARPLLPLALLALCLGCGSVGEPLPPLLNIPERSQDFAAGQRGETILSEWTWPRVTTEGMPLKDLASFSVWGMAIAGPEHVPPPETFEQHAAELASLRGTALGEYGPGEKVALGVDAAPLIEKTMALAVRGESSRGRSIGFSNFAIIHVVEPPAEPGKPRLTVQADAIVVDWDAAERADSYRVLRRTESEGPFQEVGRVEGAPFRDRDFEWNRKYTYRLVSMARTTTGEAEGMTSDIAAVLPRDTFPPAPPSALRAVPTESSVELSWQSNREPDLAGYWVKRTDEAGSESVLNVELQPASSYSDRAIRRGRTYRYTVAAVDRNSNESPPSETLAVSVP